MEEEEEEEDEDDDNICKKWSGVELS